jgi:dolichol kinase
MLYFYLGLITAALADVVVGIVALGKIAKQYKRQAAKLNIALTSSVAISILVLYYLHALSSYYYIVAIASISFVIASLMLAFTYGRKPCAFTGYLGLLTIALFVLLELNSFDYGAWLFGIGTILGLLVGAERNKYNKARESKKEVSRDVFQVSLGAIMIFIACVLGYKAGLVVIFVLLLIGYTLNNLIYTSSRLKWLFFLLNKFERKGVVYGYGAAYIVAGTSLIIGLSGTLNFMVFALATLFFGDAFATIVGTLAGGPKMPFTVSKTISGFMTFLTISAISYFIIYSNAIAAITIGVVVALVESYSKIVDDNVTISLALVLIRYIASL